MPSLEELKVRLRAHGIVSIPNETAGLLKLHWSPAPKKVEGQEGAWSEYLDRREVEERKLMAFVVSLEAKSASWTLSTITFYS